MVAGRIQSDRLHCASATLLVGTFFFTTFLLTNYVGLHRLGAYEPQPGDKIVVVGNTLAERMASYGYWESLLHTRYPDHRLVVRNLGWSADEIDLRPRSKDFDDHGHTLADHKPNVVIAMFGLNESFAGEAGLDAFRERLTKFVSEVTTTAYDGQSAPKLILCSPTPHENLYRPSLPDGALTNANIAQYMQVMEQVAAGFEACQFVDLFHPMLATLASKDEVLTINGIHLNETGYRVLGPILDQGIFGDAMQYDPVRMEPLRQAIVERNRQFYYDYRAVNGYYIYGGRKNPYGVVNFPAEFAKLRKMIDVRDQRIWDLAAGRSVPEMIDDSTTGTLPSITTNVNRPIAVSTPEESLAKFIVPEGFRVELVASEVEFPDLENPVAFEFDNRGRLWVSTMPSYPMYLPGTPPDDKILIFEDTNGDGRMDKQTVFAEGLHLPIGFVLGDGGAYVSAQPNLLFLKDTDGDDVADVRETILHGFDSADSHHSISAFTWGPDGAVYFQEGTFHHTQVETPRGPRRVKDAAVFRYDPKTEKFDIFVSYPFANPWGHCFDRWGQNFVADASGGANYFGTAFSGDVIYPNKHRGMEPFLVKQWRPTCGCAFVSSRNFPDEMQGDYLLNNTIGFLGTLQYRMRDADSGFKAEPVTPLLQSNDPNFRPVDLTFGPDGALYLVDWFNPLIGHMQHNLRDPNRDKHHGRIWRVRYTKKPLVKPPKIAGEPIDNLVPLLGAFEDVTRAAVRNELRLHDASEVRRVLKFWLDSLEATGAELDEDHIEHAYLEALWVDQHHDWVDKDRLQRVLSSKDPRARAAGIRVLCYWRDRVNDANALLVAAAGDSHPRVRLEAVRAASFLDADWGRRVVAEAMRHPLDYYLNYTIGETSTTLDLRGGEPASESNEIVDRLTSGTMPQPQLVSSIRIAARTANEGQLGRILTAVLTGPFESTIQADAASEILAAATARKLVPRVDMEPFIAAFGDAIRSDRNDLSVVLAEGAGNWQVLGSEGLLRDVALDPDSDGSLVYSALRALSQFNTPASSDAISSLNRRPISNDLKMRAAAALVDNKKSMAVAMLKDALKEGMRDYDLVQPVIEAWTERQDGLKELGVQLSGLSTDVDSAKLMLRAIYASGQNDEKLSAMLRTIAGVNENRPLTPQEKSDFIAKIDGEGNAEAGQWIFRRKEMQCAKCHALSGAGGNVGPDLSGVGATSPTEYLLDSILTPSQQIKEAYATLRVLTVDGKVFQGVKVDRDAVRLVLRDSEGRKVTIPVDDIETESEGASLMPEGLHQLLTERELIDLVAFLGELGKPGPFAINSRPTVQRYEVLASESVKQRLATLAEGELEGQLEAIPDNAWVPLYALVDGHLPTKEMQRDGVSSPESGPINILRFEVDIVVAGPVSVKVLPDAGAQVVVHGQSVSPTGMESFEWKIGRHRVFLIYNGRFPPDELLVEVASPKGTKTQTSIPGG